MVYSIFVLIIRLMLAFRLWKTGRLALSAQTRTGGHVIELTAAASLLLGFFVYLFTLILLIHTGVKMWTAYKSGGDIRNRNDLVTFVMSLIIFLKGPGSFSLDKILGNI